MDRDKIVTGKCPSCLQEFWVKVDGAGKDEALFRLKKNIFEHARRNCPGRFPKEDGI